jgi:hypothetical protein
LPQSHVDEGRISLFGFGSALQGIFNSHLISAKDFVGLGDWQLHDGDDIALSILDDDWWAIFSVVKERGTCTGEIKLHQPIQTFGCFEGSACCP